MIKGSPSACPARVAIVASLLLLACVPLEAQFHESSSSHRPISPTALASRLARGDKLTLLVLWRGSPGWFWRVNGGGGSAGGNGEQLFQQIAEGGLTFRIDYHVKTETATVEGRDLDTSIPG